MRRLCAFRYYGEECWVSCELVRIYLSDVSIDGPRVLLVSCTGISFQMFFYIRLRDLSMLGMAAECVDLKNFSKKNSNFTGL